jgi:hypothetical protein
MAPISQSGGIVVATDAGEPCHRLQHRGIVFDRVATFGIEGLNKSAIAQVKRIAWNTVDCWLEKAADPCRRFNDHRIAGITITALQADGIPAFIHDREQPVWPSTAVGKRRYRNTLGLIRDISGRRVSGIHLFVRLGHHDPKKRSYDL